MLDSGMGLLDFPGLEFLLIMVTRMDILIFFQADKLLGIRRVRVSG